MTTLFRMNPEFAAQFDIVKAACAAHLKPQGFKKKGQRWVRVNDEGLLSIIALQRSRHNGITSIAFDFFVNAAVVDPACVHIDFPDVKPAQITEAYETIWDERIAPADPSQHEWRIKAGTNLEAMIAELLAGIDTHVKTMEAVPSRRVVLKELLERTRFLGGRNEFTSARYAVVLALELGDEDAVRRARDYLDQPWQFNPEFSANEFVAAARAKVAK